MPDTSRPRMRFNPEISMGHVLQFIGMIVAVLTAYFTLDKEISKLALNEPAQQETVGKVINLEARFDMMETQHQEDQENLRRDLQRIEGKLDRLIERSD